MPALVLLSRLGLALQTRNDSRGRQTSSTHAHQREYVRQVAISLAVLVIPAALAMHRVIGELEAERFVRWTQSALGDAAWRRVLESKASPELVTHSGPGDSQSILLDTCTERYGSKDAAVIPSPEPGTVVDRVLHALRRDFHPEDNLGTRMHGWGHHAAGDTNWWTARTAGSQDLLKRHWHPNGEAGTLEIPSRALTFPGWSGMDGWILVNLAGVIFGLRATWLSTSFIATRMLLLRFVPPQTVPLPSLLTVVATAVPDATPLSESIRSFAVSERHRVPWLGGTDLGPAEDAGATHWSGLRTLLVVGALAIMVFLMIPQPDTWQRTTGDVAGLPAGFKHVGDFLGTIRKEATDSGSDR